MFSVLFVLCVLKPNRPAPFAGDDDVEVARRAIAWITVDTDFFVKMLDNADCSDREYAIQCLAFLGKANLQQISRGLSDPEGTVRVVTAEVISCLGIDAVGLLPALKQMAQTDPYCSGSLPIKFFGREAAMEAVKELERCAQGGSPRTEPPHSFYLHVPPFAMNDVDEDPGESD